LPVILGGDHAVPCVRAFERHGPIHIVQIDAHLDFVDIRHGAREGHGNPMRRAAEHDYVTGLTQIGDSQRFADCARRL
jgi:agmatinase